MTTLRDLGPALDAVASVLAENEPRHRGRWRRQTVAAHLDAFVQLASTSESPAMQDAEGQHLGVPQQHGRSQTLSATSRT